LGGGTAKIFFGTNALTQSLSNFGWSLRHCPDSGFAGTGAKFGKTLEKTKWNQINDRLSL